jgi:hypothetical protein
MIHVHLRAPAASVCLRLLDVVEKETSLRLGYNVAGASSLVSIQGRLSSVPEIGD